MKKKEKFIVVNMTTFDFKLCSSKETVASIIGVHRNTLIGIAGRQTHNGWLVVPVTEE